MLHAPELDKYRILRTIGCGGKGKVYLAKFDLPGDRERMCAIKVLLDCVADEECYQQQFADELITGFDLTHSHPNLVTTYGYSVCSSGRLCLIMEYVDGANLADLLEHLSRKYTVIRTVARSVLRALRYLYSLGVVHGDVVAPNILIGLDGTVKLTDFGRTVREQDSALRKKHCRDLRTLGADLHRLLVGESPPMRKGEDLVFPESTPPDLKELITRLLRSKPKRRFSAEDALRLLRGYDEPIANEDDIAAQVAKWVDGSERRDDAGDETEVVRQQTDRQSRESMPRPDRPARASESLASRYQLEKLIGIGGMAVVYRAQRRLENGRQQTVAIKSISPRCAGEPQVMQRFQDEADICLQLHHQNLIRVFDLDRHHDDLVIVMEYIDGITLEQLFGKAALSFGLIRVLLLNVLAGLECVHGNGVLHRDISLRNIMISRDGAVKLMDFGLSKCLAGPQTSGHFKGTVVYAPLEALEERELDFSSDLYSLSAVFYELLTGEPPYKHGKYPQILHRQKTRDITPLADTVPEDPRTVLMGVLRRHELRVFRTATDMLGRWMQSGGPLASETELAVLVQQVMSRSDEQPELTLPSSCMHQPNDVAFGKTQRFHLDHGIPVYGTKEEKPPEQLLTSKQDSRVKHPPKPKRRAFLIAAVVALMAGPIVYRALPPGEDQTAVKPEPVLDRDAKPASTSEATPRTPESTQANPKPTQTVRGLVQPVEELAPEIQKPAQPRRKRKRPPPTTEDTPIYSTMTPVDDSR